MLEIMKLQSVFYLLKPLNARVVYYMSIKYLKILTCWVKFYQNFWIKLNNMPITKYEILGFPMKKTRGTALGSKNPKERS